MNAIVRMVMGAVVVGVVGSSAALADGCPTEEEAKARVQLRQAEEAERAGKLKQAYEMAQKIDCLYGDKRIVSLQTRIGLQLGQQEEQQGRLDAAFDWFERSRHEAEADRVKMKKVSADPGNRSVVSNAIDHFKSRGHEARLGELRALAEKNFVAVLAAEEKAFAAHKESFRPFEEASGWAYLLGDGAAGKIRARAEQRGDALLKEDTHRRLDNALRYFGIAKTNAKESAVRDKARRLAQEHEKRGEIAQARDFYSLAGESERGGALEKKAEAQHKKSEAQRQKKFKNEQDDLEKQLGL